MVLRLASAALRRRPLRTFLTALGIAVAVGSTVVFLSLGEGLRQAFRSELGSIGPDLQISYGEAGLTSFSVVPELALSLRDELLAEADRFGIERITPLLVYLRSGLTPTSAVVFQGLPTDVGIGEIYVEFAVSEGRALTPEDAGAFVAVVGEQAALRAGVEVGGVLRLNPRASFEVVGLASAAAGLLDNTMIVPLEALQRAIEVEDRVTTLLLDLVDPEAATEVAAAIQEAYPDLAVQTRGDLLSVVERGLAVSDVVRLGISAIALIVGAIAVANTMLMSVFERTREFGVVRAVGARPRFLFSLVLVEAVALSLVGAAFGVVLGYGGAWAVNRVADDLIGLDVAAITPRLVAFAVAVAMGMGLVAGLLPAARAARVPIAVALARE
ncbi:MAG: ABC transporter permease [Trueperaceae bacterium]|nr:ABC transporter permease [Trueperaceae bacterium]